jgi:hypothetical protein
MVMAMTLMSVDAKNEVEVEVVQQLVLVRWRRSAVVQRERTYLTTTITREIARIINEDDWSRAEAAMIMVIIREEVIVVGVVAVAMAVAAPIRRNVVPRLSTAIATSLLTATTVLIVR